MLGFDQFRCYRSLFGKVDLTGNIDHLCPKGSQPDVQYIGFFYQALSDRVRELLNRQNKGILKLKIEDNSIQQFSLFD